MRARYAVPGILVALAGLAWTQFALTPSASPGTSGLTREAAVRAPAPERALPSGSTSSRVVVVREQSEPLQILATDLSVPWDVGFLPDGTLLIAERGGRVLHLTADGRSEIAHPAVRARGEGGLLGLLVHPRFEENRHVYLYRTLETEGRIENQVDRFVYEQEDELLRDPVTIIGNIPGALYHDGGRMEWGPNGKLYITTGDAQEPALAQDPGSLAGKILRLNHDGTVPHDNPTSGSPVFSLGHRNPQGIAWDAAGRMWSSEHGPSLPGFCCRDEINQIEAGANYGWPEITAGQRRSGLRAPYLHSGTAATWAPGGLTYLDGSLFFAGLRGEALYQVPIERSDGTLIDDPELIRHFQGEYGRLRTTRLGPDGLLYLTTSNTDGRGTPQEGDDKLIRIDPTIF